MPFVTKQMNMEEMTQSETSQTWSGDPGNGAWPSGMKLQACS